MTIFPRRSAGATNGEPAGSHASRNESLSPGTFPDLAAAGRRHFVLQPILNRSREVVGYEALFRAGWVNEFDGDLDRATRIMIDNWLLFGFEDITGSRPTCLNCTRETFMSGLLTLLPSWAMFEILESVEPDEELLKECRRLKEKGYRFGLDDYEEPKTMEGFLGLVDFVKIDFRLTGPKGRVELVRSLKGSGATLIAEKIETEEEFRMAVWEGFELFQGFLFTERASFAMTRDTVDEDRGRRLLNMLDQPGFASNELVDAVDEEPGIACRLLRRANWTTGPSNPVNSVRDALKIVGKSEFRKLVMLALYAEAQNWNSLRDDPASSDAMEDGDGPPEQEEASEGGSRDEYSLRPKVRAAGLGNLLKMPVRLHPKRA